MKSNDASDTEHGSGTHCVYNHQTVFVKHCAPRGGKSLAKLGPTPADMHMLNFLAKKLFYQR